MQTLGRFIRWGLRKLIPGLLIAGVPLAAGALWLSGHDQGGFTAWRREQLRALGEERARLQRALVDVRVRMDRLSVEISAERERTQQAERVIGQLKDLESTWDRYVGNREQQLANAEQLGRMTKLRADAGERTAARQQEFKRTTWERDGLEIARGNVEARLGAIENDHWVAGHYLNRAWRRLKVWIMVGLGLYYVGWPLFRFRRWLHADKD